MRNTLKYGEKIKLDRRKDRVAMAMASVTFWMTAVWRIGGRRWRSEGGLCSALARDQLGCQQRPRQYCTGWVVVCGCVLVLVEDEAL